MVRSRAWRAQARRSRRPSTSSPGTRLVARPEHEVVDQQLGATVEELRQGPLTPRRCLGGIPSRREAGEATSLASEFVPLTSVVLLRASSSSRAACQSSRLAILWSVIVSCLLAAARPCRACRGSCCARRPNGRHRGRTPRPPSGAACRSRRAPRFEQLLAVGLDDEVEADDLPDWPQRPSAALRRPTPSARPGAAPRAIAWRRSPPTVSTTRSTGSTTSSKRVVARSTT